MKLLDVVRRYTNSPEEAHHAMLHGKITVNGLKMIDYDMELTPNDKVKVNQYIFIVKNSR